MEPNTWIATLITVVCLLILIGCTTWKPKPKKPMAVRNQDANLD